MTKTLVEILKFLFSIQKGKLQLKHCIFGLSVNLGSNCFSPPTDNPLKKDECEANLKTFETLATLQVGIFIVSKPC